MEQIELVKNKIRQRIETQEAMNDRYEGEVNLVTLKEIGEKLFKELEDGYGIPVPATFDLCKDDKGSDIINIETVEIEGRNLEETKITPEVAEQIEDLYTRVAKYLSDKFKNGGFFLTDINSSSQYVYGKKGEEQDSHIYLVDTDLYLGYGKVELYHTVKWLIRHMPEKECGKEFEKARKYIKDIIYSPIPDGVNDEGRKLIEDEIKEGKLCFEGRGREWKGKDVGIMIHEVLDALNKI